MGCRMVEFGRKKKSWLTALVTTLGLLFKTYPKFAKYLKVPNMFRSVS